MIDTGKTVSVLGKSYPVMLDNSGSDYRGMMFRVDLGNGQTFEDPTSGGVYAKARDFKDVRFDLPFTTPEGREGSITGFHAGTGNLLVRWSDGKREQCYGVDDAMPQLSDEDRAALDKLLEARNAAYAAHRQFVQTHKFPDGIKEAAKAARLEKAGLA